MIKRLLLALPLLAAPLEASAAPAIGEEARIAFPNNATIRTFRADDRDTVYIQDRSKRWYRGEIAGPCFDLPFARAIGIDTRGSRTLDRFSTLLVEGERCQLISFVRVSAPPERRKERRRSSR